MAASRLPPVTAQANRHRPSSRPARQPGRRRRTPPPTAASANRHRIRQRPDRLPAQLDGQRREAHRQLPGPRREPADPAPRRRMRHPRPRPPPGGPRTPRQRPARSPRRPSRPHPAARPARTPAAAHDSPRTARHRTRGTKIFRQRPAAADMPPVTRPEHQRPGARRAVRPRDLHLPASRHVRIDRQRARPYDGHGRITASDPFSRSAQNEARRDPYVQAETPQS